MDLKVLKKVGHILFSYAILCGGNIVLGDYQTTIYTPNGSIVPDTYIMNEMSQADIAYGNWWVGYYYPNATRLTNATRTYNCHGYAWHISEGGNNVWIGKYTTTAADIYWQDCSYVGVTTEAEATRIGYYYGNHSAITTTQSGWFKSKWGSLPLMRHQWNYCPYSSSVLKYYTIALVEPPTSLYISGYQGGLPRINWTASTSPDIDHYELWWNEVVGPPYGWQLLATTSATSWVDSRVTIDSYSSEDEYGYKARAVNDDSDKSCFSNEDYVLVDECPPWLCKKLTGEFEEIPEVYALGENYPNPFNPSTTIQYDLSQDSRVRLTIYDIMGREVYAHSAVQESGYWQLQWQGQDHSGKAVPSGIYIYRLVAIPVEGGQAYVANRKMLLLK